MTAHAIDSIRMKYMPLVVWSLLFVAVRLLILFSGIDGFISEDELITGAIAKMLIGGISPGLVFFCYGNYHFGLVTCGILVAPFFRLFGDSLMVLRGAALFYSLGTLILFYLFLFKFFNRKTAILATLFFILSPPNYIKTSFILVGGYAEINFFSILAFFIFYRIFFAKGQHQWRLYALFGLVCGYGLFHDYTFLLTMACCLLFWLILDNGMFLNRYFYIFFSFFIIGFSPWIYYNITHHWNALFIYRGQSTAALFTKNRLAESLNQLAQLVISIVPEYFRSRGLFFVSTAVISRLYYSALLIPFIGLIWLQRKFYARIFSGIISLRRFKVTPEMISPEMPIVIYILLFALAYSFCGFSQFFEDDAIAFPLRIVVFIIPHIFIIAAVFIVRLSSQRRTRPISILLTSILVSVGLLYSLEMICPQNFKLSTLRQGYNYFFAGRLLREKFGVDIKKSLQYIKSADAQQRLSFCEGHKWGIPDIETDKSIKEYVQKTLQGGIDQAYWPYAYEALGVEAGRIPWYIRNKGEGFETVIGEPFLPDFYRGLGRSFIEGGFSENIYRFALGTIDKQYMRNFHEGMGMGMDGMFVGHFDQFNRMLSLLDKEARLDIYRGFAHGRRYPRIGYRKFQPGFGKIFQSPGEWIARINSLHEDFKPYYYQRLGIEIGWRFIDNTRKYRDFLQNVDPEYKLYVYKGLGIGIGWRFDYPLRGCLLLIERIDRLYRGNSYEGLGVGIARRYAHLLDRQAQEGMVDTIPREFRGQFRKGLDSLGM